MSKRGGKRHSPEQIVKKLRDGDAMLNVGVGLKVQRLAESVWRDEVRGGEAAFRAGG